MICFCFCFRERLLLQASLCWVQTSTPFDPTPPQAWHLEWFNIFRPLGQHLARADVWKFLSFCLIPSKNWHASVHWAVGILDQTSCLPQFGQIVSSFFIFMSFSRTWFFGQANEPCHLTGPILGLMEAQMANKLMGLVFSDIIEMSCGYPHVPNLIW